MAYVRFLDDYTFTPDEDRRVSVKYRKGWAGTVRQQCRNKAVAAGKAEDAEPLDHDGDGLKGGSRPGRRRRARLAAASPNSEGQ
jgi:hypothetical protein